MRPRFRAAVLLAASLGAGAGCAPSPASQQQLPPQRRVIRMPRNIVGGLQPATGNLTLNAERTIEGSSDRFELFARWSGEARVDVQSGESLVIAADSQEFRFKVLESGIYRDFQCEPRCIYDDRAYYPATREQVEAIANAKHVTVRLVGSKQTVERDFNEVNFERFREFMARNAAPPPKPQSERPRQ
jgi:hypothetical protein